MSGENLSPERQEELRAAKSAEELEQIAEEEGCELSVDMLDGAAGRQRHLLPLHTRNTQLQRNLPELVPLARIKP